MIFKEDKEDFHYEDVPDSMREAVKEERSKRQVFKKKLNNHNK